MFCENNLGKDYFNISKHELRLRVCNNERDLGKSLRSLAEYLIHVYIGISQKTMMNHPLVNTSRIEKFQDLCNEDIVGRNFPITDVINEFYSFFKLYHVIVNSSNTYSNIRKYYLPIFIILGLLGNCLSAIVLFRKKMRFFSSNIYLGVLAMSDIVYLMILLINWLQIMDIKLITNYLYYLIFFKDFLFFFSEFLSVWLIVAFTIERFIVTKYPLLRRSWCTVKRAKIVVITLMGLAMLRSILYTFYLYRTMLYKMFKKSSNMYDVYKYIKLDRQYGFTYTKRIIDSIIIFILPAVAIVICNTLIGYHIYQQNRVRKTLITTSDSSNKRTQISSDKMLQHKITKMLILVTSVFLILKLPVHYTLHHSFHLREYANMFFLVTIFDLLDTAHYSINFVLYCATGQTFRRELIRMFTKRTNKKEQKYYGDV
nr:PREDICTED: FMRFamide receptor-like [Linepithema humile]